MGLTTLKIEISNIAKPKLKEPVEFLVDSSALYSVVPAKVLKKLGIKPLTQETYSMVDGTQLVRKRGFALFRYGNRIGGADVIFGEVGDSVLLGATALESMGLSLDPLRRELRALPILLATRLQPLEPV